MTDSFPRQYARTRGFTLGLPRAFRIADDGSRVTFLRSRAGDDTVAGLWVPRRPRVSVGAQGCRA